MMSYTKAFSLFSVIIFLVACSQPTLEGQWENLLDDNLSKWEVFLGVPHKSSGIPGYEAVEDVRGGKPLGLGNRRNIFSVIEQDGEQVLKITGEIFGSLATRAEYENYHLAFDVKWGQKKWEPRLKAPRNNGLLYHSVGEHGTGLWNTWMSSLEFEVEEANFGDFITINDNNVRAKVRSTKKKDGKYYYDPAAPLSSFCWGSEDSGRCQAEDFEKPNGEWNTLELICYGDEAIHIVNGEVVMRVKQPAFFNGDAWVPMNKGKLQIQSEAAETFFKDIRIRPVDRAAFVKYN